MAFTQSDLEAALIHLGVLRGSILLVHSSFKSLGALHGGAATVIAAVQSVLGPSGTLLMPSFNMASRSIEERATTWNIHTTPSTVGYLTEYFRCMPGTLRSNHYSHSIAARGARADWITKDHEAREGWISPWDREPWGHTYGTHSPMIRAMHARADVLFLGVDYHSLTYAHVAEVSDYNRRLALDAAAPYRFVNRSKVGAWWQEKGIVASGKVGDADCRLFNAYDFVDGVTDEMMQDSADFY